MKIWLEGKIIDAKKKPLAIILSSADKKLLKEMRRQDHIYLSYPISMPIQEANALLESIAAQNQLEEKRN